MDNYFEQVQRLQEQINKLYGPTFKHLKQIENITKNLDQICALYKRYPDSVRRTAINLTATFNNLSPQVIEALATSASLTQRIAEWQSTMKKINNPAILETPIPKEVYPPLNEVTHELETCCDSSSDLSDTLAVVHNEPSEKNHLTWNELLIILLMVLPIILQCYYHQVDSAQQNAQHQELMNELRHQQEDGDQQNHRIQDQRLEEKFGLLMVAAKNAIPENDNAEVSHDDV